MPATTSRSFTTWIFKTQSSSTVHLSTTGNILLNLFQTTCHHGGGGSALNLPALDRLLEGPSSDRPTSNTPNWEAVLVHIMKNWCQLWPATPCWEQWLYVRGPCTCQRQELNSDSKFHCTAIMHTLYIILQFPINFHIRPSTCAITDEFTLHF